jgi:DNA-binding transcriptional ArsR family regulator
MANEARLQAVGDPTRQKILERLRSGPRPVGEIAAGLPVTRPAISQHLKVLKDAGLVEERRVGTRRIYAANPAALGELRTYIDGLWRDSLETFAAFAEQKETPE